MKRRKISPSSEIAEMLSDDSIILKARPESKASDQVRQQDRLSEKVGEQPKQPCGYDAKRDVADQTVHAVGVLL